MRPLNIFVGIVAIFAVIMGVMIYWDATVPQIDVMYVTSVNYDEWRGSTWVYSYDRKIVFSGIHYEIEVGNTYRFEYVSRLPWAKLISVDTHDSRLKEATE